jgi:acyl-CoA reductase-like NAD-dependent aldehyde dehydrogenase
VRSPLVNHICFTGSEAGGLAVQKAASDRIHNFFSGPGEIYIISYVGRVLATKFQTNIHNPIRVNHICFTGSEAGGLAVQKAASDRIVNVGLELGGIDTFDSAAALSTIEDSAIHNFFSGPGEIYIIS